MKSVEVILVEENNMEDWRKLKEQLVMEDDEEKKDIIRDEISIIERVETFELHETTSMGWKVVSIEGD